MPYYNMEVLVDNGVLDYRVAKDLNWQCKCGWAIVQTPNGKHRKCSNPHCPVHLSYRADAIFKRFRYINMGPARAEEILINNRLTSHFDVLNKDLYENDYSAVGRLMWDYSRQTRDVYLHEIVMLASIPGVQDGSKQIFAGYPTFESYFQDNNYLMEYKDILISAQKYFTVIGMVAPLIIQVMATGSLGKYRNRELYFHDLNRQFAGKVFLDYKKTNVQSAQYLICDDQSSDSPKLRSARQRGIPIYTSSQFLLLLAHNYGGNKE